MKHYLLAALLILNIQMLSGQQRLTGSVADSATGAPLKNVEVHNRTLNSKTQTDAEGRFGLAAQPEHAISFSAFAYRTQTIVLGSLERLRIQLSSQNNLLQEVEVKHLKTAPSTWQTPACRGQSMVYQKEYDDPSAGGVVFRVWYWKKDEKRRKKRLEDETRRATEQRISQIFTPQNISLYVPLRGEELESFIFHYTPSAETYSSRSFDLLLYLNDSYKNYQQLPASERKIPELTGK